MVRFTVQACSLERSTASNGHAVLLFIDVRSHGLQLTGHHCEAIGLLHPQLGGATDPTVAITETGGDAQDRHFIHQAGHDLLPEGKGLERSVGDTQIPHRFSCHIPAVQHLNPRLHLFEDLKDARARWVEAHVFDREIGTGNQGTGHKPERCRTDIPRHHNALTPESGPGAHLDVTAHLPTHLQVSTKGLQHPFAVVPRLRRFNHGGWACGGECGQQQCRFHLGAGHRGPDHRSLQALTLHREGCQVSSVPAAHIRSHRGQGLTHPPHRSTSQ